MSSKEKPKKKCKNCGKEFPQERGWQKFCNKDCRWEKWRSEYVHIKRTEYDRLKRLENEKGKVDST